MARTLLSRSNVETIARESDLDITTNTANEFEDLVTQLAYEIQLKSAGRDNIYNISLSSHFTQSLQGLCSPHHCASTASLPFREPTTTLVSWQVAFSS